MLRGAQSIWIHLSNCKNRPQQSLQLQWAHAPHSTVPFFWFWKRRPVWAAVFINSQCFCLLSAANPIIQHSCWRALYTTCFFLLFSFNFVFFSWSLVRPLESVCYWAQSVKVSSCKVCEVCSVCIYVYLLFVTVSIYVYLCLCLYVYLCLFMSINVYCKCLMCEGPQL